MTRDQASGAGTEVVDPAGVATGSAKPGRASALRMLAVRYRWESVLLVAVVATFIFGATQQRAFLTPFSLSQMIAGTLEIAVIGVGVAMLMIVAEIDISVGSVMGLCVTIVGKLFLAGMPFALTIPVVIAMGVVIGLINGFVTVKLGVPSLVVTVAALALYRGLSYAILGTDAASGYPDWFTNLATANIGVIPLDTFVYLAILLIAVVVVHFMTTGRRMFATGMSLTAARYAGIRVNKIKIWLFIVSSVLAVVAGLMYSARLASASPDAALGFELYAITVALLGGINVFGGRGTLLGVFLATLLIMQVRALLALYGLPGQVQDMAVGLLLVVVAILFAFGSGDTRRQSRGGVG